MTDEVHDRLTRVVREHASRLVASLINVTGDFATAEDLVQDAVLAALRHWPEDGIPERPDAWLFTVARRRGLDVFRREGNYRAKLAQMQWPVRSEPDDRLQADVHLLPPGPAEGGADRAHPAGRVRPDHSPDRPSVPGARNDDGAADHPRQTEDHGGGNSVPDPEPMTSWALA